MITVPTAVQIQGVANFDVIDSGALFDVTGTQRALTGYAPAGRVIISASARVIENNGEHRAVPHAISADGTFITAYVKASDPGENAFWEYQLVCVPKSV